MFRKLPPVRVKVPLVWLGREECESALRSLGQHVHFFTSGTEALSAAILECKARGSRERTEVILPAYACPDLVSACEHAKVTAKLVDLQQAGWGYDAQALQQAIGDKTLAVVAMNLLGIGDEAQFIRGMLPSHVALIQDSAQYSPRSATECALGDYAILSFGRGKPLNMLGGGALLTKQPLASQFPSARTMTHLRECILGTRLPALLFNFLTAPSVYPLSSRMPGLRLGATRYTALESIQNITNVAKRRLTTGLVKRSVSSPVDARLKTTLELLATKRVQIVRTRAEDSPDLARMLRLPFLAGDAIERDIIVRQLNARGLGASTMYDTTLERIAGVPATVSQQGPFVQALSFSKRFFTLPTPSLFNSRDLASLEQCVKLLS